MITTNNFQNCSASITTNRNRIKQYGSNVYLQDGQKFEIELFNGNTIKVLAKIKLNGSYISSSGIVLRPGERVYLERFIDENKAFVFSTYAVDSSPESAAAIALNGNVQVEFYSEFIAPTYVHDNFWHSQQSKDYTVPYIYCGNTMSQAYFSNTSITNGLSDVKFTYSTSGDAIIGGKTKSTSINSVKSVETGRVEGGSLTAQQFTYENSSFNNWAFADIKLKILPASQKPIEVSEIRHYCPSCGSKHKPADNFCRKCGAKL